MQAGYAPELIHGALNLAFIRQRKFERPLERDDSNGGFGTRVVWYKRRKKLSFLEKTFNPIIESLFRGGAEERILVNSWAAVLEMECARVKRTAVRIALFMLCLFFGSSSSVHEF